MTALPSSVRRPPLARAIDAAAGLVAQVLAGRTPEARLECILPDLRPAALDLAYGALRDYGRGDFLLGRLLERPLADRKTHALLLVALSRLERNPMDAHTLVDQAVEASSRPGSARFKGLVNAVLRNFLRRREELLGAAEQDDLARWRHPRWWLDRLRSAYPEDWRQAVEAGNNHPPLCLRVNVRRTGCADFLRELSAAGIAAQPLDDAAIMLDKPLPVERIPGFTAGCVSVQDWGAQRAACLLDVRDGMRVLDACAAPGGKTGHLLELADLDLTALEIDPRRAQRIRANLARLGLSAKVRVADATQPQAWWDGRFFDRILADVPCSASGVARRHPDIKWLRRPDDVAGFVQNQAALLEALWPMLAPNGKMLYCTCSVFPEENGMQVRAFLARHPDSRLASFRTLPDQCEMQLLPAASHDGFYYALLEKTP